MPVLSIRWQRDCWYFAREDLQKKLISDAGDPSWFPQVASQKIDISEELERIDTHISEVRRILKQGGVVGRRLDFLMQELNREANTLGAKSVDVDTTRASVELKVLIV